jgi:ribonucleoside-diphosphate reductase alpha chain
VEEVLGAAGSPAVTKSDREEMKQYVTDMKFVPGGRYLYYAGRPLKAYNNCYLLKGEEDTREEWGNLLKRASDCLMTGGGIGIDYSVFRPEGAFLRRTGGKASGPIPLMHSVNEVGRNVMQGGSRRSAIYASLNWQHGDATRFLAMKDWHGMKIGNRMNDDFSPYTIWHAKQEDFNYHAPLDMTNVSLNYDDEWLFSKDRHKHPTFRRNIEQALRTGEPGFSFNFGEKQKETLRNACTEVTSEDDSDVCNLGSVNMSRIESLDEFKRIVELASKFLVCGTLVADLPYKKVEVVRSKNRRLGLGLMGIHEWMLKRGYGYEVTPELHNWLWVYKNYSEKGANELCDQLGISRPVAYRAIAPTGTIGMIAGLLVACLKR